MPLQEAWKIWIYCRLIWGPKRQLPFPRQLQQPGRESVLVESLPWRDEFGNDVAAISHQYCLARSNFSNVFAQTVFQFPKAYAFHTHNVAS